jgi:hypothetical protein
MEWELLAMGQEPQELEQKMREVKQEQQAVA